MIRIFILLIIFLSNHSLADEKLDAARKELHRENRLEIMAYGRGVAEAITDIGEKSSAGRVRSENEPNVYLPIIIERIDGISAKRIKKKSNETILAELSVTKDSFRIPFGGTLSTLTKEYAISSLGDPAKTSPKELIYYAPSYINDDILIITFEKDKAKSIRWIWWDI